MNNLNNKKTIMKLIDTEAMVVEPLSIYDESELIKYLKTKGLDADARGIFLTYSNLSQAVISMADMVGTSWPSLSDQCNSAIFSAVEKAVLEVKAGLKRREDDHRYVVINFLKGLMTIIDDLVAFNAVGMKNGHQTCQWMPLSQSITSWYASSNLDSIKYTIRDSVNQVEVKGLVWKLRSVVSTVHDLGLIHLYGDR
jgi:hypothetical protein